jgi:hypothetical protein
LLSRILVELDFRKAVPDGIEHGRKIGDIPSTIYLRPVH